MSIILAIAVLSLLAWIYLLFWHGGFWKADQKLASSATTLSKWPEVAVIIPARNEAETIGQVLRAHLNSTYPGRFSILVLDDQSSDDTAAIAKGFAGTNTRPIHVLTAPDLSAGWTGKLAALNYGVTKLKTLAPEAEYVLFTDADIEHGSGTLTRLMTKTEREGLALASLMARLDGRGVWGSLLIPAFIFFFQKLYPFSHANDADNPMAAAAGGCVMVKKAALEDCGGLASIKDALIDDCALAGLIKGKPPKRKIWLGLADDVTSLRDNRALSSIWSMVARTAYTQLRHSPVMLIAAIFGMALVYLAGPAALIWGVVNGQWLTAAIGLLALLCMAVAYYPTLRDYNKPALLAFTLPLAAVFYMAMTITSALRHWRGAGGQWKGRSYSKPAPGR